MSGRPGLKRALRWAAVLLMLGASAALLWRGRDELSALRQVSGGVLVALVLAQVLNLGLTGLRFHFVNGAVLEREIAIASWLRIFIVGRFLNVVAPQAGNVYRAVTLRQELGVPPASYAAALLAVTWLLNLQNLLFAIAVLAVAPPVQIGPSATVLPVAGLAAAVLALAPPALAAAADWLPMPRRLAGTARTVMRGTLLLVRSPKALLGAAAAGLVVMGVVTAAVVLAFDSLGVQLPLGVAVLFVALLQLSATLSITPGNLGVAELGFAGLAEATGQDAAVGVLASGIIRAVGLTTLAIMALSLGALTALRDPGAVDGDPEGGAPGA
ncbi:MAG: flippase-like domain-containing protein [Alphaproteobacteria bacterium]|nr:flippase-like domain-containing protein [Alphaproteobacteria bacterium]